MKTYFKLVILLFLILIPAIGFADSSVSDQFEIGKKAYFEKNYSDAQKIFSEILKAEPDNGYLYYNLGNTYFKMGQLGKAIQSYEKALSIIPRDSDLKLNLSLARTKLVDQVTENFTDYLDQTFYFWLSHLTLVEIQMVVVILSVLFWSYCLIRLFRKKKMFSARVVILTLFFGYVIGGYLVKQHLGSPGTFGIILPKEVAVKANYLDQDKPLFQLHEGTKVRIIDKHSFGEGKHWLRVVLPDGPKGWVSSDVVGII